MIRRAPVPYRETRGRAAGARRACRGCTPTKEVRTISETA